MELDPLLLSRIQFAFVVSFHAVFPMFTIGLASYIALLEALRYKTGNPIWGEISQFWIKIFAVVFGMGVVSGIVMSFQFGTNWSNFSYATANFMGPLLAYEVITAFFLEAAFLGVLLFGRDKVPPGVHLFAAIMVALGTFISSFWILSANSWMHTPAGFEVRDGIYHITSWTQAIFNPSFPPRLLHTVMASFLSGGFVVAGVSAWYLLRGRNVAANRKALSMTLWLLAAAAPTQLLLGDYHGLNTFEHQTVKVAAMEGNWETQPRAPLLLFAIPDSANETNHFEVGIPGLASLILTHELDGVLPGLKDFPAEERPPVGIVFWAFRVMVGIGLVMIGFGLYSLWLRWRGRLFESRRFLKGLTWMIPTPFIAMLAGWFVTEVGRFPWLVWELMPHSEGVTPSLTGGMTLFTLLGYIAVYAVIFVAGIYYLIRIVQAGMEEEHPPEQPEQQRPARPLSAADIPFNETRDRPHPGR
jgi:cytochrome bd ubiquinol oxidase subunit I